ncbi:GNAT family N-acetyltransferase [Paenibacillus sp. JX-17]|uniref:GNAT family N-acetyltransferase n=1 Tax=Paenibacillus lacisoli TaxID=3064525 RepID=A0ABT9CC69_9BACL|nr:GNAT family N-acetyltransferase [Paenibacillus sp. JX-17]MDO7906861.1 GNAT family N-acetyltransferase [Paenibacillus sp. JX-17]
MREIQQNSQGLVMVEDGQEVAEIGFQPVDDHTIMIDHTYVSEQKRGQKLGDELVKAVVEMARKDKKQIVPECSFALAQFKRHEEYQDVWQKE